MRIRSLTVLAAVLLTTLAAPARGASDVPTEPVGARVAEPVGPGWYLAEIDRGKRGPYGIRARTQRLVLVGPDGNRRRILQRSVHRSGGFRLLDWSPDGSTALLLAGAEEHLRAIRVDVATGDTHATGLPADVAEAVLAPDGSGVLAVGYEKERTGRAALFIVDWTGTRHPVAPDVSGPVLPSADGTTLVTAGPSWRTKVLRVLSATDGSVQRRITTTGHCQPVRWWDASRVLATCATRHASTTLSLVSTSSGTVKELTDRRHGREEQDLGDLDARRIDSGLYVEVAGPCGYVYLGRKHRDGSVTQVDVPHAVGNVLLLDGSGDQLVIEHAVSCDGAQPRSVIARFDPVAGKERVITALPREEGFGRILRFGDRQATAY
jgi:hypothetical protein